MATQGGQEEQPKTWRDRISNLFNQTWEMEILLFGFVLVYLWQVPAEIVKLHQWADLNYSYILSSLHGLFGSAISSLLLFTLFSVIILIISMIVHLILRGFWIAAIGLNSAFPDGIQHEKLPGNPSIRQLLQQKLPYLNDFEQKLERICSGSFAFTILLVFAWLAVGMVVTYGYFIAWCLIQVVNNLPLPEDTPVFVYRIIGWSLGSLLVIIPGLLYAIDFISMGAIKQIHNKWFARPYYFIYRFFSILTLAPLSRPLYYTFITNISNKKARILFASIPVITFVIVFYFPGYSYSIYYPNHSQSRASYLHHSHYVKRLHDSELIQQPVIPQPSIQEPWLELFFPYKVDVFNQMTCDSVPHLLQNKWTFRGWASISIGVIGDQNSDTLTTMEREERQQQVLSCIEDLHTFSIDQDTLLDVELSFYTHPRNDVPGFITYFPLKHLRPGKHVLTIERNEGEEGNIEPAKTSIPFYYHPSDGGS